MRGQACTCACPGHWRTASGFSLIEAMVASAVFLLLLGGVSTMLGSASENYEDTANRIDAQQSARIAMEQVQRDLQVAGVGLSRLQPPFPVVVPRPDGGIDLRINRGLVTTFLTAVMTDATSDIEVNDASAFGVGQWIAVYDAAGSIDMAQIAAIDVGQVRISHGGLSKAYDPAAGAAVAVVETVTYRPLATGSTFSLIREVDGLGTSVVAANLTAINFSYFDNGVPPAALTPTTLAQQLLIRVVEAELVVQAAGPRLAGEAPPVITLSARVTPRSLVLF
jgi:type II secretory pathway pseudopilin PulG